MIPDPPVPTLVPALMAAGAAGMACLQWILAGWRDLGPITLGWCGAALLVVLPGDARGVFLVVAALVVAAGAWARGARHGVGRPGLNGAVLAVAAFFGLMPWWLPALVPVDPVRLRALALPACVLAGGVGGLLALERPGPRKVRLRWVGRIPIEAPEHRSGSEAPERARTPSRAPGSS